MKSNFLTLMKVDLRETLDFRRLKVEKTKSISFLTALVLFGLLFLAISFIYNLLIVYTLKPSGRYDIGMVLVGAIASIVCLSTAIFRVKSIFTGRDYEMLKTMPIKKRDIIASKLVNLYIIETLYASIFILPCAILSAIFSKNFIYIPFGLIYCILVAGFPIIISSILSALFSIVFDRLRIKNIISILFYVTFFVLIFMFSFMSQTSTPEEMATMYENMGGAMAYVNPTIFLLKLAFTKNYAYILLYIATSVLSLVLGILFISLLFDKVYDSINSIKSDRKYVRKALESRGQFKALFLLECKRLFSSKMYFINCLSSVIVTIVLSIMTGTGMLDGVDAYIDLKKYAYVFSLLPIFCLGICTASSASISIEGKNLWLVKSMPIDYHKWINAKMLLSLIISAIGSISSSIILIIVLNPNVVSIISLIIIPFLFVLTVTPLGLFINLIYHKFDWNNEREVVKNSASVSITLFIDWGLTLVFAATLIGLSFVNIYLAITSTILLLVVLSVVLYRGCHKGIENRVLKL